MNCFCDRAIGPEPRTPLEFFDPLKRLARKCYRIERLQQRVEKKLVAGIRLQRRRCRALPYMPCTQRINQELLCHLQDGHRKRRAGARRSELFSFVKVRPDSDCSFCMTRCTTIRPPIWNHMDLEREEISRIILEYYQRDKTHYAIAAARFSELSDLYVSGRSREGYTEYIRLLMALYDNDEA